MELRAFRHLWGLEREPLSRSLPRIAERGYAGVEVVLQEMSDLDGLREGVAATELAVKPLLELRGATPREQIADYRELLELALSFEPEGVTVQSGRDYWPVEDSVEFYRQAVALEIELGLKAGHETHRGRSLFAPWCTATILEAAPELLLVCDFSHWVVVSERLLEDQAQAIELAAAHAVHLHARVGYDQGPQVPDPRRPEAAAALAAHERWWEIVWDAQRDAGATVTTFTPEYGPPPYLHEGLSPSHLDTVCDWQADRVREHFEVWTLSNEGDDDA